MIRGLTPALQTSIPVGKWLHQRFSSRTRPGIDAAPGHLYSRWRWHWATVGDAHWVLEPEQHNYACPARTLRMLPPGWGEPCKASPTMACQESRCPYLSTPWLKNNFPLLLNKLRFCWLEQPRAEGPLLETTSRGLKTIFGHCRWDRPWPLSLHLPTRLSVHPSYSGRMTEVRSEKGPGHKDHLTKRSEDMGSKFKKRH